MDGLGIFLRIFKAMKSTSFLAGSGGGRRLEAWPSLSQCCAIMSGGCVGEDRIAKPCVSTNGGMRVYFGVRGVRQSERKELDM